MTNNTKWKHLKIHPSIPQLIADTNLPKPVGFGSALMPIMAVCDYDKGQWGPLELLPYAKWEFDPSAKGLHYGQQIFEGMKSYWTQDQKNPTLFRWEENFKRFNESAIRMAMPTISAEYFLESLTGVIDNVRKYFPRESGQFMYLRPFMVATERNLGIAPSQQFRYGMIASATESYLTGDVSVLIERNYVRASLGGTGFAKTGGNYARGMLGAIEAKGLGYQQVLWLDAVDRDSVEEMSGMNFFVFKKVHDTLELITPTMKETILNGTTRNTILHVAKELGFTPKEVTLSVTQLIKDIQNKVVIEGFACGTASTIAPIMALGERDKTLFKFASFPGENTLKLRSHLLDLFEGRKPSPSGWVHTVV